MDGADAASTPAHAGTTMRVGIDLSWSGLYPRARGDDGAGAGAPPSTQPLPPRTRGRLVFVFRVVCLFASTPAHAGTTSACAEGSSPTDLYPRARGDDA